MTTLTAPPGELRRACVSCGENKMIGAFYQRKEGRIDSSCKECRKAKVRAHYWADPEAARKSRKFTYTKHREKILAANSKRRPRYLDRESEYQAAYKERKGLDAYRAMRADQANRRRVKLLGNGYESVDRAAIIARDNSTCHICGRKVALHDIHLDHLIPVSKGGPHTAENLAVAHSRCNIRRRDGRLPAQLLLVA